MLQAQQVALSYHEVGALDAFVTTIAYRPDGYLGRTLSNLPFYASRRLDGQLRRRAMNALPADLVRAHPQWEAVRLMALQLGCRPTVVDRAWDRMSHAFDALVARRYTVGTDAIHAYEYTALATFRRAREEGVARILHLPSIDSFEYEELQQREKAAWPELVGPEDVHFDARFDRRYARRRAEIALADVIVANSSLTAQSHIRAGADPDRVFVASLGAPPPIEAVSYDPKRGSRPLKVLWAGTFCLRKGAHYLVDAWRRLAARRTARLDVYGFVGTPSRLSFSGFDNVVFHGSVPQSTLFRAYEAADVLVFPTLSDGFGMVVSEALAHGLPVITTNRAGAAELLGPDSGLIVPAGDPEALADALIWCLDNRSRLVEMRQGALEAARARQWDGFRRDLVNAVDIGLRRRGYAPARPGASCQSAA